MKDEIFIAVVSLFGVIVAFLIRVMAIHKCVTEMNVS